MDIPAGDIETIRSRLAACLDALPAQPAAATTPGDADEPEMLRSAFDRLLDVMQRVEADGQARPDEPAGISELGEYAMQLYGNLVRRTGDELRELTATLAVELALWIAGHGGRLDTLEPVVDGLAMIANSSREPAQLEALCAVMATITDAVAPVIREDLEKTNPGRPWRVLLLNRGIVATRSHNTRLMEEAFGELTRHLPEDAARFFTEGMQQMEALDYPPHVREVMESYHRRWSVNRALH